MADETRDEIVQAADAAASTESPAVAEASTETAPIAADAPAEAAAAPESAPVAEAEAAAVQEPQQAGGQE